MKHHYFCFLLAYVLLITGLACSNIQNKENDWQTWWEKSEFLETPRYEEAIDYCKRLAEASHEVHYTVFGVNQQGRERCRTGFIPRLCHIRKRRYQPGQHHHFIHTHIQCRRA